jgi:hypothetical protein
MLARHFRRRQRRPQAFRDNLTFLLQRKNTASIATRDDLDLRHTSTRTTKRRASSAGSGSGTKVGVASMADFHHSAAPRRHVVPLQRLRYWRRIGMLSASTTNPIDFEKERAGAGKR